jgi:DNA repair exonuclease SbcCD nuclease subunit
VSPSATPVRLAHLSDTHLGLEAYRALSTHGDNLRALDMVRAFSKVVTDIIAWDPELVVHSGDVFDRPSVPTRYLLHFRQELEKLAGLRPDGTRRQVVIISGNHDQPRSLKEVCSLELFASLPGVHVVTAPPARWARIDFPNADGGAGNPAASLSDVCVTAVPHDCLKSVDFDEITPRPGYRDVFTTHGVAAGSELYLRALGREYPVPVEVLQRQWAYVALGHYHKQGPVTLGGTFATVGSQHDDDTSEGTIGRIWYAGSTENCSFRDLRDNGEQRGYLRVTLPPEAQQLPSVSRKFLRIRPMFRLPVLEAAGLEPAQIQEALIERIKAAVVGDAVVGQVVTGISREMWSLVDLSAVKAAAASATHYEVTPRYTSDEISEGVAKAGTMGDLPSALEAAAAARLTPEQAGPALEYARLLLGKALDAVSSEIAASAVAQSFPEEGTPAGPEAMRQALLNSEATSPDNSAAAQASSDPSVAAARVGRNGKPTRARKPAKKSPVSIPEEPTGAVPVESTGVITGETGTDSPTEVAS